MATTTKTTNKYRSANICTTEEHLAEIVEAYLDFDEFVFDVETRGEYRSRPARAEVAWIGLAGPGRTDVIPMTHQNGVLLQPARQTRKLRMEYDTQKKSWEKWINPETGHGAYDITDYPATFGPRPDQLQPGKVFVALEPLFFSNKRKIGHNVRFDLIAVAKYFQGRVPPPPYGDTISAVHLYNERMGAYRLDFVINKEFGLKYDDGKLGKIGIDNFDFWTVARYLRLDLFYTWLLWKRYFPRLKKRKLERVFKLEMAVLEALIYMELEGTVIDVPTLDVIDENLTERLTEITEQLWQRGGKQWNLDDHRQKGWFVYEVLKNKPTVFTPKRDQPSTKAEHLTQYRTDSAGNINYDVEALIEYAELKKLKSVYVNGIRTHLLDGRLYPAFLQAGTETGRFSCAAPNLQNIPRDSETSTKAEYSIRQLFVPPEGYKLIVADYSQIEYRLFAHFSEDEYMIEQFIAGVDAHQAMACRILKKKPEQLRKNDRTQYGKVVNFAIGFGAAAPTLSAYAGISIKNAEKILRIHRQEVPGFYAWKEREIRAARMRRPRPYVVTLSGRRRQLGALLSGDRKERSKAERQVINTKIQGSAADIIKAAMVRCHRRFVDTPVQLVLTVHDELVFHCPDDDKTVEWATDEIRDCMEQVLKYPTQIRVPLVADIESCYRWSDGKA